MDTNANTAKKVDETKSGPSKGADSTARPDMMAPNGADAIQYATAVGRIQTKQAIEELSRLSAACAEANVRTARELTQQSIETGRKLFDVWAAGTEGAIRSSVDLQNALLSPGLSYIEGCNRASEACARASREAVERWSEVLFSTQRATLETWQTTIRAAKNCSEITG
jgi:hypothetical protein